MELPYNPRDFKTPNYGLRTFADLFTSRQLITLNVFVKLLKEVREKVVLDAKDIGYKCGLESEEKINAYAQAVITYLAFAVDRLAVSGCSLATWNSKDIKVQRALGRQVLPMTWDFAEVNFFGKGTGNFIDATELISDFLFSIKDGLGGIVRLADATSDVQQGIISTDPPYYDNIGYGDISDFFYVWLRRMLFLEYPELFSTLLVPKHNELVATPYRFDGDKEKAKEFFEDGLKQTFKKMLENNDSRFPTILYYAFKQSEDSDGDEDSERGEIASTGWETMLNGLVEAGFQVKGTWPMRTEMVSWNKNKLNSLASSIVIVCYPRPGKALSTSRRDFLAALKRELAPALRQFQQGNIAPVDLAQAAIGPGMAVFSRYKQVLEADGSPMRVRSALGLINKTLDEFLAEQEGEYDSDTRWALAWFEQYGHEQGPFGVAETLSKAKNTSVDGLVEAGFLEARAGKVRLLRRDELDPDWDPQKDKRLTAWEACQHLIYALDTGGESAAASLLSRMGALGENARDLAYRLYTVCERKGWAQDALGYNMLVVAWPRIKEQSGKGPKQELCCKQFGMEEIMETEQTVEFHLNVKIQDSDLEEIAEVSKNLAEAIRELNGAVTFNHLEVPKGAMGVGAIDWNILLITLLASGGVITSFIALLQAWLTRDGRREFTIKFFENGEVQEISLKGKISLEQKAWIEKIINKASLKNKKH